MGRKSAGDGSTLVLMFEAVYTPDTKQATKAENYYYKSIFYRD